MHAKGKLLLLILFLMVLFEKDQCLAASGANKVYTDALAFYENYGSSQMVFHDGYFYYGSRGSAGAVTGIRYGVCGQRFTIHSEGEKLYTCSVALEGSKPGSCKRISYQEKEGYKYSLYTISYDRLFDRFQKKYPSVDFSELMYNHQLVIQADFYLCLVLGEDSQGSILEKADGSIEKTGKVYSDYESISAAAPWSPATMEALHHYYDIRLSIYQPSYYWVNYQKNHSQARGTMEMESFQYGEKKALNPCKYTLSYEVVLKLGEAKGEGDAVSFQKGRRLKKEEVTVQVESPFLGWSKRADRPVDYQDQERVMNLSRIHQGVVYLYGVWEKPYYQLPDILDTAMFVRGSGEMADGWKSLRFLGWSRDQHPILPAGSSGEAIEDLLPVGSKILLGHDQVLYGVWSYEPCHFVWEEVSSSIPLKKQLHYSRKQIGKLRKSIKALGFMCRKTYGEMASGGFL